MGLVDKKKRELSFLRKKKYFSHPPPNFKAPVLWTTKILSYSLLRLFEHHGFSFSDPDENTYVIITMI